MGTTGGDTFSTRSGERKSHDFWFVLMLQTHNVVLHALFYKRAKVG